MRNSRISAVIILSTLIGALLLTGCVEDNPENYLNPLIGTWDLTMMTIRTSSPINYTVTFVPGVDTVQGTVTLNKDSTFKYFLDIDETLIIPLGTVQIPVPVDTTISSSGTWTSTDTSLILKDPQVGTQTLSYKFNNAMLITSGKITISTYTADLIQTWGKRN